MKKKKRPVSSRKENSEKRSPAEGTRGHDEKAAHRALAREGKKKRNNSIEEGK